MWRKKTTTATHRIWASTLLLHNHGKWAMNRVVVVHIIPKFCFPWHDAHSSTCLHEPFDNISIHPCCHESFFSLSFIYINVCVYNYRALVVFIARGGGSVMTRWIPQTTRQFTAMSYNFNNRYRRVAVYRIINIARERDARIERERIWWANQIVPSHVSMEMSFDINSSILSGRFFPSTNDWRDVHTYMPLRHTTLQILRVVHNNCTVFDSLLLDRNNRRATQKANKRQHHRDPEKRVGNSLEKKKSAQKKRNRPADRLWYCTRLLFMSWRRFWIVYIRRGPAGMHITLAYTHTSLHIALRAWCNMCVLLWAILIDASNRWWYMVMRLKGEPRPKSYS
jgi:hypothetical protein